MRIIAQKIARLAPILGRSGKFQNIIVQSTKDSENHLEEEEKSRDEHAHNAHIRDTRGAR